MLKNTSLLAMVVVALTASQVVSAAATEVAGSEAISSFDGTWTVTRTGVGCRPTGQISIRIRNGKISGRYRGGTGVHRISGEISEGGKFRFEGRSTEVVVFRGNLSGNSGQGSWNVNGRNCRGNLLIFR